MTFTSLSGSRRDALPGVLVGPVLGLVLADQVSVLLVFMASTKVTLEVFDEVVGTVGGRVMAGTRNTVSWQRGCTSSA